jgi:hypothetical protein
MLKLMYFTKKKRLGNLISGPHNSLIYIGTNTIFRNMDTSPKDSSKRTPYHMDTL